MADGNVQKSGLAFRNRDFRGFVLRSAIKDSSIASR